MSGSIRVSVPARAGTGGFQELLDLTNHLSVLSLDSSRSIRPSHRQSIGRRRDFLTICRNVRAANTQCAERVQARRLDSQATGGQQDGQNDPQKLMLGRRRTLTTCCHHSPHGAGVTIRRPTSPTPFTYSARHFSISTHLSARIRRQTRLRQQMWTWLNGPGAVYKETPKPGSFNYLGASRQLANEAEEAEAEEKEAGEKERSPAASTQAESGYNYVSGSERNDGKGLDKAKLKKGSRGVTDRSLQPFPLNPYFRSQSVLSERFREEIYKRVVLEGHPVREVSQDLGVDMNRVGAVVRLMKVQRDWVSERKHLATPYQTAIHSMLPVTPFNPPATPNRSSSNRNSPETSSSTSTTVPKPVTPHEPINSLPIHPHTQQQLFHPVSESRHFTRGDAGTTFREGLLPAESRIPHPDMVKQAKEAPSLTAAQQQERRKARFEGEIRWKAERARREKLREKQETVVVRGERCDFKVQRVRVGDVRDNVDKKAPKGGVGWRYGVPLMDRKKGQKWIPQSVEW
ncbi:MAG: hypothetical protein M1831_000061 [Alyxoria varia]|nr:MAG: hypothetical protein M1831_000061 [Alyxoria varia]